MTHRRGPPKSTCWRPCACFRSGDRTLLGLRYVAGFDATEIGVAMGMSASGVRTRLSRVLDRLRTEVDDV